MHKLIIILIKKEDFFMEIINDYISYLLYLKAIFERINLLSPLNHSRYLYNIFVKEDNTFDKDILNE